jgi:thiol-disulfide isomerase/thioredoxin
MTRRFLRLLLPMFAVTLAAQTTGTVNLYPGNPSTDISDLTQAVADSNGSPGDLTRALERHLLKYPDSTQRAAIEASLWKGAVDSNDHARIILYGEKLLATRPPADKPNDELETLDRVIRALLASDDTESARKALTYAKRYLLAVDALRARPPEGHTTPAQWADLADRALARASVVQARATGNLGDFENAEAAAQRSWQAMPTAEAAREMAKWLVKLGRDAEAVDHYADAVVIDDPNANWAARDYDRKIAATLYAKVHGSEDGLGELFNRAWERSAATLRDRTARFKAIDPNYGQTDAFGFTLPAVGKQSDATPLNPPALDMGKLKGKTLVVDFWATWCGPCVAQHPIIERLRQTLGEAADVVFISLNSDDDHTLIVPFLKAQKWDQRVYLEAGLAEFYNVTSLPTILVISPSGALYSRVMGMSDNFERILSARISEARAGATP